MKPLPNPKEADVLGTFTPPKSYSPGQQSSPGTAMNAGIPPGTGMSAGASHGSPSLDTASLGKSYQTSVHFQVCIMFHWLRLT